MSSFLKCISSPQRKLKENLQEYQLRCDTSQVKPKRTVSRKAVSDKRQEIGPISVTQTKEDVIDIQKYSSFRCDMYYKTSHLQTLDDKVI